MATAELVSTQMQVTTKEGESALFNTLRHLLIGDKNVLEEIAHAQMHARRRLTSYSGDDDFALERPKDDHAELDCGKEYISKGEKDKT
jgi:hypothetical protein